MARRWPGGKGCLSFPEIYGEIVRPEGVAVRALNEWGSLEFKCGGLLARAVLHEYDHLQGILFIDRMSRETKESLRKKSRRCTRHQGPAEAGQSRPAKRLPSGAQ
jgi:peptide deformylase